MSWAEVFKINSDMSKPLNDLINGSKGLRASDNLYTYIHKDIASIDGTTYEYPERFKFNWQGSVNISYDYQTSALSGGLFKVTDENDNIIISQGITNDSVGTYTTQSHTIVINTGIKYKVTISCTKGILWLQNLRINADLIDLSGIEIEV